MRLRGAIVTWLAIAAGCGGGALGSGHGARGPAGARSGRDAALANAEDPRASFAELAASAADVAPGLRELTRFEGDLRPREIARAEERDLCVRVSFSATEPIDAALVDGRGAVLTEVSATRSGHLGPRGPVCVRRGESVHARFEGPEGARVRAVVWGGR